MLRASTAVHSQSEANFGRVVWSAGRELLLECDTALAIGAPVELKVSLDPIPGCALLKAIVVRGHAEAGARRPGYILHIGTVSAVDKAAWDELLAYRSGVRSRPASSARPSASAPSSAAAEPNAISEGARQREATRLALKAALEARPAGGGSAGSVKRRSREPELIQRTAPPASADSPPKPPPPKAATTTRSGGTADVRWSATVAGGREYLEVVWQAPAAFAAAVRTQLAANVLTIPVEGAQPPCVPPIVAVLRFGTLVVQSTATPCLVEPHRVSYHLNLDGSQFAELRRAAAAVDRPRVGP